MSDRLTFPVIFSESKRLGSFITPNVTLAWQSMSNVTLE
jgi:hypothetical protein